MLVLKQAIEACGIQQKALVAATGFGKTQISLTLSSGKLPADAGKFKDGVYRLITEENGLAKWLEAHNYTSSDLFKDVWEADPDYAGPALPFPTPATLGRILCDIAGRAALDDDEDPANVMIIRLARAVNCLHGTLVELMGQDSPYLSRKEDEAAAILKGGFTC